MNKPVLVLRELIVQGGNKSISKPVKADKHYKEGNPRQEFCALNRIALSSNFFYLWCKTQKCTLAKISLVSKVINQQTSDSGEAIKREAAICPAQDRPGGLNSKFFREASGTGSSPTGLAPRGSGFPEIILTVLPDCPSPAWENEDSFPGLSGLGSQAEEP
jgi:hypothetical protein